MNPGRARVCGKYVHKYIAVSGAWEFTSCPADCHLSWKFDVNLLTKCIIKAKNWMCSCNYIWLFQSPEAISEHLNFLGAMPLDPPCLTCLCIMRSGLLCITSTPIFKGDVVRWLFMHTCTPDIHVNPPSENPGYGPACSCFVQRRIVEGSWMGSAGCMYNASWRAWWHTWRVGCVMAYLPGSAAHVHRADHTCTNAHRIDHTCHAQ